MLRRSGDERRMWASVQQRRLLPPSHYFSEEGDHATIQRNSRCLLENSCHPQFYRVLADG
jgi:hypothetical protein